MSTRRQVIGTGTPRLVADSPSAMQPSHVVDRESDFQTCFFSLTQDRPDRKVRRNHQPVFASSVLELQDFVVQMSCSAMALVSLYSKAGTEIGGRVTQTKLSSGHVADLGANWIHGTESNPIMDLAKITNTSTHDW